MNKAPEERFYSSLSPVANPFLPTAPSFDPSFEKGQRYWIIEQSFAREPVKNPVLISELGCGDGSRLIYLQRKYCFASALGVDLRFAETFYDEVDKVSFLPSNLNQSWPLDDSSCDVLIAMMVIEHLFDPMRCFCEIERVLAPSGRAFVNLPLISSVKNRFRLLVGLIPITSVPYHQWFKEGHWDGFHLHYFTLSSIYDLAAHSGLQVASISSVGRFYAIKSLFPSLLCNEISLELRRAI